MTDIMLPEFQPFPKISRRNRAVIVTEKIDGTNGIVHVSESGIVTAGSRSRWITPEKDNAGFAAWVAANVDDLRTLGLGYHYGEWWGSGIQRRYGLTEKRFSLFNVGRWSNPDVRPACYHVVPVLGHGFEKDGIVDACLQKLIAGRLARCARVHAARGDCRFSHGFAIAAKGDDRKGRRAQGRERDGGSVRSYLPILAVIALACAMLFTAVAQADAPTLVDRLERAAQGLPCPKEPQQDARALARAIAAASRGDRTLAAAMLTTAWVETALADRIRRNDCRPRECDSRRAWGSFQRHKNQNNAELWGSVDIDVQATDAARALRSAFYTAKAAHAPFPAGMFRIYAGRRPDTAIPREALRVSTFDAVRRQL